MFTLYNVANIFLFFHSLLLFTCLTACEITLQNMRNSKNICHIALDTVRLTNAYSKLLLLCLKLLKKTHYDLQSKISCHSDFKSFIDNLFSLELREKKRKTPYQNKSKFHFLKKFFFICHEKFICSFQSFTKYFTYLFYLMVQSGLQKEGRFPFPSSERCKKVYLYKVSRNSTRNRIKQIFFPARVDQLYTGNISPLNITLTQTRNHPPCQPASL